MSLTAMPVPATRPAGSGCGCGGGGSGGCGGGSCGCGGATVGQPAFVRPRFFAGQLLTEDDLELLSTYVTGKNRLHDRHLFGPGVVCGLQVVCNPCGGGRVRVLPGYALDCCGNDIVVPCPEDLDINALVRDLRVGQLGEDCGDPCADQDGQSSEDGSRHYCLYVRYLEELTEPVAPYATEEPCGHQACEPSRVREGFRFLLRCDEERTPREHFPTLARACLPPTTGDVGRRMERLDRFAEPLRTAARTTEAPGAFEAADAQRLRESREALDAALAGRGKGVAELPDETARSTTEHARRLASALARFDLQDDATRAQLVKDHPDLDVDGARATLASASKALGGTVDRVWDDRMDREVARALVGQAARVAAGRDPLPPLESRLLAEGLAFDPAVWEVLLDDQAALKEWLLDRLDQTPNLSDCELRTIVAAIPVAPPAERDPGDLPAVRRTATSTEQLAEAVRRYVVDCVCAAVNPPCVPCTDSDVLLACLEVRDCEVVRVCNAARDYVLTGPALRYWVPALDELRDRVEQLCCGPRRKEAETLARPGRPVALPLVEAVPTEEPAALFERLGLRLPVLSAEARPEPSAGVSMEELGALRQRVTELTAELADARGELGKRMERLEARVPAPATTRRGKGGRGGP